MEERNLSFLDHLIWMLTVLLLLLVEVLASNVYGSYVFFGITIVILLLIAVKNSGKLSIKFSEYHFMVGIFAIYALVSSLWALRPNDAISKGITIFEILVCMSVFYMYYEQNYDIWRAYNAIRWAGFLLVIYTIAVYGMSTIRSVLASNSRLATDFANINSIAMLAAVAITITAYEIFFRRINIITIAMSIPSVIIVAASGSRKALVFSLLGVLLILLFRYAEKNILTTIFKWGVIGIVSFLVIRVVLELPMFAGIMERMQGLFALVTGSGTVDSSAMKRSVYIQVGWEYFLKHPIVGAGIGSSGDILKAAVGYSTYLHNNFVELLACGGIVGFFLYYLMYGYCCKNLIRDVKNAEPITKLSITILVLKLVMDYGNVSYYSKTQYFYLMLFFIQAGRCAMSRKISKNVI